MPPVRHCPAVRHQPGVDLDVATPAHGDHAPVAVSVAFVARYLATLDQSSKCLRSLPTTGPAPCVGDTGLDAFRRVDAVQTYFGLANVHGVAVDHQGATQDARLGLLRDRWGDWGGCDRRYGVGRACRRLSKLRIQKRGAETHARAQNPQQPSQAYLPPSGSLRFGHLPLTADVDGLTIAYAR